MPAYYFWRPVISRKGHIPIQSNIYSMYRVKIRSDYMDNLMPSDININNDLFLGETSVQITGFHGYPSIHIVRSYLIRLNDYDE